VHFSHIANLIKKRKVFIMQGEAFVSEQEMMFVFVSHFRRILISSFEVIVNMIIVNLSVNCYYFLLFVIFQIARETRANLYNDERFTFIFANLENSIHTESTILVQEQELQQYISLNQLDEVNTTNLIFNCE